METALRQIRAPVLVTAPTVEPVSVSQIRAQCGIDTGDFDDSIADWIRAARNMVETDAEIALASSTWALYLDCFPYWEIELRKPPVQSLTSIVYLDGDGTSQTLSSSLYLFWLILVTHAHYLSHSSLCQFSVKLRLAQSGGSKYQSCLLSCQLV